MNFESAILMKKILLLGVLACGSAYAADFDLANQIGDSSPVEQVVRQKNETEVADDRGIFSFLNFSFIKKTKDLLFSEAQDEDVVNESPDETPLQRVTRLAESGRLDAQLTLGYVYLYGENGVEKDFSKAFHYYEMAAAQNDPVALNNLGSLYFNGIGTEVNYRKAAELFLKAANQGSDDAAVNLAFIYLSGDAQDQNQKTAVKLFEQAAKKGNNTAKFMWGYANYKGFQTPKNPYKAVEFIRQAAEANFDEAQFVLGQMYLQGQGISQNYGNAVRYFRLAAAQGNLDAMMTLGQILAEGKIYPQNFGQAYVLFNIASVYAVPGAVEKRTAVEAKLKIEELLPAQAEAEKFKAQPSELTSYVRQTFGSNARRYIDDNLRQ